MLGNLGDPLAEVVLKEVLQFGGKLDARRSAAHDNLGDTAAVSVWQQQQQQQQQD